MKKFFAIAIIAVAFAACTSSEKKDETPATPEATETVTPAATPDTSAATTAPVADTSAAKAAADTTKK